MRCLLFASLFLAAIFTAVNGDHERVICDWIGSQKEIYEFYCRWEVKTCQLPGVECFDLQNETYYAIYLQNQNLSGPLPSDLANITTLVALNLDNNSFASALPEKWSRLSNLRALSMANNLLTGVLPEAWSSMTSLRILNLANNNLTGNLTSQWSNLTNLTDLILSENNLGGELPQEWSTLTNIQTLILNNNTIGGQLPSSWSSFSRLSLLDVSHNYLDGSIPESWESLNGPKEYMDFSHNPDLWCNAPESWDPTTYNCLSTAEQTSSQFTQTDTGDAFSLDVLLGNDSLETSTQQSQTPDDSITPDELSPSDSETETQSTPPPEPEDPTTESDNSPDGETGSDEETSNDLDIDDDFDAYVDSDQSAEAPSDMVDHLAEQTESNASTLTEPVTPGTTSDFSPRQIQFCSQYASSCESTPSGLTEQLIVGSPYLLNPKATVRTVYGLNSLDTSRPTVSPHKLLLVLDHSFCEEAPTLEVELSLVCSPNRAQCESHDGTLFCSPSRICIAPPGQNDELDEFSSATSTLEVLLNGPASIEVSVGDSFLPCDKCSGGDSEDLCDPGVTAVDSNEGDLTAWIETCIRMNSTVDSSSNAGDCLQPLEVQHPGHYLITYSVVDSAGKEASAARELIVFPVCQAGTSLCEDTMECLSSEECFLKTGKTSKSTETELDSLDQLTNNTEPSLDLIITEDIGPVVKLPANASYQKCDQSLNTTVCEPGVRLTASTDEQADYKIYACPSDACKYGGSKLCETADFDSYGLESCSLDTKDRQIQGQIEIVFMAVPSNSSWLKLFTSRGLEFENSCRVSEYFCRGFCSPLPCEYYETVLQDNQPVIHPHFPKGLTLAYGVQAPLTILPCESEELCGVHATDLEDGDLTADASVVETTPCEGPREECIFCDPVYVSSGSCLPGYYRYKYTVQDSGGNQAEAFMLDVNIVEIAEVELTLVDVSGESTDAEDSHLDDIRQIVRDGLQSALSSRAEVIKLSSTDFGIERSSGGDIMFTACLAGLPNALMSINGSTRDALQHPTPGGLVQAMITPEDSMLSRDSRSLLEDTQESTFLSYIEIAGELVAQIDVDHLSLVVNGTKSELLTKETDRTLGALLSVMGEMDALYQESIAQIESAILSLQASLPDTTEPEINLTRSVTEMFSGMSQYYDYVRSCLGDGNFELVTSEVEQLIDAARAAADQTRELINAQLSQMNRMQDYAVIYPLLSARLSPLPLQAFIEAIRGLSDEFTCTDSSGERRYSLQIGEEPPTSTRRLLQDRSAKKAVKSSSTGTASSKDIWAGYEIRNYHSSPIIDPKHTSPEVLLRGAVNHRNFLIGGIVLQTERSIRDRICYGRFAHLIDYCYTRGIDGDISSLPYGRDPVFIQSSSLYDEEAALRKEKYYDTSEQNLSPSGIPFGFYPAESRTKLGVHFAFVDIQFGKATAAKLLEYLFEGQFLDGHTDSMTLSFVTYNPDFPLAIMAVYQMKCIWRQEIECEHRIDALSDIQWTASHTWTIVIISALTMVYWLSIGIHLIRHRSTVELKDSLFDLAVVSIMTISLLVSLRLIAPDVSNFGPSLRFSVYDSETFDGAHWLLSEREDQEGSESVERWRLPDNSTDISRLGIFLDSVREYRNLVSVSNVLQTVAIIGVIVRLLCVASKIHHVSVITHTLQRSASPMIYFLIPFGLVLAEFAVMATVCFGHRIEALSSLSNAFRSTLEFVFFAGHDFLAELIPKDEDLSKVEIATAALFKASLCCLSIFIFLNFVMAILTDGFLNVKEEKSTSHESVSKLIASIKAALSEAETVAANEGDREVIRAEKMSESMSTLNSGSDDRVIYINEAVESFSDEDLEVSAGIPLKRLEDVAIASKGKKYVEEFVKRLEIRVRETLMAYESLRQWADDAARTLQKL